MLRRKDLCKQHPSPSPSPSHLTHLCLHPDSLLSLCPDVQCVTEMATDSEETADCSGERICASNALALALALATSPIYVSIPIHSSASVQTCSVSRRWRLTVRRQLNA